MGLHLSSTRDGNSASWDVCAVSEMEVFLFNDSRKEKELPLRRSSKSRCLPNPQARKQQDRGNAPVSEMLPLSLLTPYPDTLDKLSHLEWLKEHLKGPPSYPPTVLAARASRTS